MYVCPRVHKYLRSTDSNNKCWSSVHDRPRYRLSVKHVLSTGFKEARGDLFSSISRVRLDLCLKKSYIYAHFYAGLYAHPRILPPTQQKAAII